MLASIVPAPHSITPRPGTNPLKRQQFERLSQELTSWAPQAAALLASLAEQVVDTPEVAEPDNVNDNETSRTASSTRATRSSPAITARLDPSLDTEEYALTITDEAWVLRAGGAPGAFWAAQTLRQMSRTGVVHNGEILDRPQHAIRGVMLDLARTFFGVPTLEWLIDIAASYKYNQVHLHLSDDQGWRLEIAERPLLTELASGTDTSGGDGGFLTLAQYQHLQEYATARHIVIVPEIDLPGHTHAAMLAYPEISPDGAERVPYTGVDVGFSAVDLTSSAAWAFIEDVIGALARTTIGPRIHLGGDEALTLAHEDYVAFIERLGTAAAAHGKVLTLWQEAAAAPLPAGSLIQFWNSALDSTHLADVAASGKISFIASPGHRAYLDQKYIEGFPLGQTWAGTIELRDAYEWMPDQELSGIPAESIVGVEACLWTETIHTFEHVTTMLLPRLPAIAEVAWGSPRDWERFAAAIAIHGREWAAQGLAFYRSPQVDWN